MLNDRNARSLPQSFRKFTSEGSRVSGKDVDFRVRARLEDSFEGPGLVPPAHLEVVFSDPRKQDSDHTLRIDDFFYWCEVFLLSPVRGVVCLPKSLDGNWRESLGRISTNLRQITRFLDFTLVAHVRRDGFGHADLVAQSSAFAGTGFAHTTSPQPLRERACLA